MSKEWLAQLSATAAAAKRRGRASSPPAQSRPQPSAAVARGPDIRRRGFIGAIIGSIIRWAVISAIAGAVLVFVVTNNQYLQDSVGEKVTYTIWYLLDDAQTSPVLFAALERFFPAPPAIDANAVYEALKPYAGLLPFLLPLVFGVAVTLLFLPTVNAYRRRSGGRFFILLLNLAVLLWIWRSRGIALDLSGREGWFGGLSVSPKVLIPWAFLLLLSFAGWRRVRPRPLQQTVPARSAMVQGNAPAQRVPSHAASAATRSVSATQMMPQRRGGSPIDRSVSGSSWRRPR